MCWFVGYKKYMQIADLPSEEFRMHLLTLMTADLVIVVGWERIMRTFFRKKPNDLVPLDYPSQNTIQRSMDKQRQKNKERADKKAKDAASLNPWQMAKKAAAAKQAQQQRQQSRKND